MKITQDVRDFAAAQGGDEKAALETVAKAGMETKAVEFVKSGAEAYRRVLTSLAANGRTTETGRDCGPSCIRRQGILSRS